VSDESSARQLEQAVGRRLEQPWMDAVKAAALAAGLPPTRLHEERFAW
jgi:ferredoxin-NADP reductase